MQTNSHACFRWRCLESISVRWIWTGVTTKLDKPFCLWRRFHEVFLESSGTRHQLRKNPESWIWGDLRHLLLRLSSWSLVSPAWSWTGISCSGTQFLNLAFIFVLWISAPLSTDVQNSISILNQWIIYGKSCVRVDMSQACGIRLSAISTPSRVYLRDEKRQKPYLRPMKLPSRWYCTVRKEPLEKSAILRLPSWWVDVLPQASLVTFCCSDSLR